MISLQEYDILTNLQKVEWFTGLPDSKRQSKKFITGVGIYDYKKPTTVAFTVDGKVHQRVNPCFGVWRYMVGRCYDSKVKERQPTYIDTTVCEGWLIFSNFQKWWLDNYIEGWQLDKDLLTDNKQYSPENCIYIPSWLNKFTIDHGNARGEYLIGVTWYEPTNKFSSRVSNGDGKQIHLGYYPTEQEAHLAWKAAKLQLALDKKLEMNTIDTRLYPRVVEIINRLT